MSLLTLFQLKLQLAPVRYSFCSIWLYVTFSQHLCRLLENAGRLIVGGDSRRGKHTARGPHPAHQGQFFSLKLAILTEIWPARHF
jgi:hypothetical protein